MEIGTQIGMTTEAWLARTTRLGRIHGNAHALLEMNRPLIHGVVADDFDGPRKLVTQDERRPGLRVADAAVEIRVQIAAANAGSVHTEKNLTRAGRPRILKLLHAQIPCCMEAHTDHSHDTRF